MRSRIVALIVVALLAGPAVGHTCSPDMDPNGCPSGEAARGPGEGTNLSPDMDPNGLIAGPLPGPGEVEPTVVGWLDGVFSWLLARLVL
jgi:hypothetical protein